MPTLLGERQAAPGKGETAGLRLRLHGVARSSPLAERLEARLTGQAFCRFDAVSRPRSRWRRQVRGTSMQWWTEAGPDVVPGVGADADDIDLDLHRQAAGTRRSWCIVDAAGVPLLHAFHALDVCRMPPYLASLYLIESCDGGASWQVAAEAHLSSARSYRALLDDLGDTCAELLRTGLSRIAPAEDAGHGRPWNPTLPARGRANGLLRARIASAVAWLKAGLGGDLYGIAILDRQPGSFLIDEVMAVSSWSEIPARDGFIADPFFWPGRPEKILCEIYSHTTGLGRLAAVTLGPGGISEIEPVAIAATGHLSYPFAWAEDGEVFCLPEMAASGRQVLCRLIPGHAPVEVCVVAENTAMADPTLMRIDGTYWLAYTDADIDPYNNLCLMHADRLEGPWRAHAGNPVKIDARSSRPGGMPFRIGDALFRPSQDCSRTYGGALVINRVRVCTAERYEEEAVVVLWPDPKGRYPDGVHTLSFGNGMAVIDGKRISYHPAILFNKLARRLRRDRPHASKMRADTLPTATKGCQTVMESSGWHGPTTEIRAQ